MLDETGKVCRELKVTSHPDDLAQVLQDPAWRLDRVGLEAGPLSQWLYSGLAEAGVPVVCIETRHTKAFLKAQVNKTDRNDARGIAQMMRVNLFRPVHVKTLAASTGARCCRLASSCRRKRSPSRTTSAVCCATSASRSAPLEGQVRGPDPRARGGSAGTD